MSGVPETLLGRAPKASGTRNLSDAAAVSAAEITAAVALEIAGSFETSHERIRTTKHENPDFEHDPADQPKRTFGNSTANRSYGTALARFASIPVTTSVARSRSALRPNHPALKEGRTIFPRRVFDAADRDRVLISGINNMKLGKRITKGPWAGSPFYVLSLEERKTCPRSCPVWDACYGNGLVASVRFKYNANLMRKLAVELEALNSKYPNGFAVRLHALGDFPDLDYVKAWAEWSDKFKALQIEGYTAHPRASEIGQAIWVMNLKRPKRWQVRNSVAIDAPYEPMQVSTLWDGANQPPPHMDALVCPQELGKTQTCGTCALCWSPTMADKRVLFLGHGGRGK